ncbi:esterase-like activity of phytase family protein [Sphingopyxis sp. DBS4]|uniref:esterase-like activity of phytase family protein n=1 Tax=Sphingopyxis sp. DBS4 TaxID=2968500 RepID=UPI00214B175E|nr:esterase-like activity of phytase family protein [Sphingopyxis sp. DBS4]
MVGGLSGIDYRSRHDDYLLISDDRGTHGGGKAYAATIDFLPDHRLSVHVADSIALRQANGRPFSREQEQGPGTDAESVRAGAGGWIYWSSEGDSRKEQGPDVYRMRWRDGRSFRLPLPSRLLRDPGQKSGPRDNRSFEGLWVDQRTHDVWLGIEAPLIEDGPLPTLTSGAWTRIMRLPHRRNRGADFLYPLEPIARALPGKLADNGLSELLVLPGPAFLVLERSGSQQTDGSFRFTTRLFCAAPKPQATASSGTRVLEKRLVANLNDLGSFDSANFEGVTFGRPLPDGRRSLILVADNNFDERQPNRFLVLAVDDQR